MKEQLKELEELKQKIQSTWELLGIEASIVQMHALEQQMQQKDFWDDPDTATKVSKNHEELRKEIEMWSILKKEVDELISLGHELETSHDTEMTEELNKRIGQLTSQFEKMEFFVLLDGRNDKKNALVAIHAGSGGTEAQDWAETLMRMIMRYAEHQGWKVTMLDESKGQEAGIKSAMLRVEGRYAYGHLKSEHGTHRLVRISPFDAESMRHTSFALIEVLPEVEKDDAVEIDPKDLRIDTFMASGKGGQSVNTTYSAVRVVHLPTGISVSCQNERSQLQNKETALRILQSKLQVQQEQKEEEERLKLRGEYKSPEWGNQIRSYVLHPYKMVKDVRTKYEVTDPEAVLNGGLNDFVEAYLRWRKAEQSS